MPERTEEQGDAARLKQSSPLDSCMADQLFSLSQPSDRMDSLEEAGVGNRSAESVGLALSRSDALFTKQSELTAVPRDMW